ncbi:ROK family transcriptional regulator [Microbacterium ulmi]|uniref:ROK family transcriptional regulator n=1 Tax=Microbacterium ulmi TaxID=179095 RepID=A0A7Y2M0N9_9MICO|nr:ROK family transcriptional regulator [Microbacterium ulmi]
MVDLIRSSGPISRVELTAATGLTQPAVSIIVRKLIQDGLVRETGSTTPTAGKPRTLLTINARAVIAIGIQLGVEDSVFVAVDSTGGIFGRQGFAGAGVDAPQVVIDRLVDDYRAFLDGLGADESRVAGVAVVAPGPINVERGLVVGPPSLRRWVDFPLRDAFARRVGPPVLVDNDSAASAVGEFWTRQISRESTYACLYMGGGIGAGLVSSGALYRGSSSNTTELGHVSIDLNGRDCFCGNRGCVERYAAPSAVVAEARSDARLADELELDTEVVRAFDAIARAAVQGHPRALDLIVASARHLAEATVNFANIVDPDSITLAGWGFAIAGSIYAREIGAVLAERAFARRAHGIDVALSSNPRDSAAVGAAALILQSSLTPGHGPALHEAHAGDGDAII